MLVGLIHSYIDRSFNYQHRGFISRRFRGFLYPNAKLTLLSRYVLVQPRTQVGTSTARFIQCSFPVSSGVRAIKHSKMGQ
jgi:hypothetical protein